MVPTILGQLTRATNVLTHQLEARIVETGMRATEYLVLRTASVDADATAADVRRSLGLHDAAFSDAVRRAVAKGYAETVPAPRDRRTRRLVLTLPGSRATWIAACIQADLEAQLGVPKRQLEIFRSLDNLARILETIPPVIYLEDGLPTDTA